MTIRQPIFALGIALVLAACPGSGTVENGQTGDPTVEPQPSLTAEQAAQARRTIVRWLECEECTEGELAAVLELGRVAVPTLSATLIEGPSPARDEEQRQHLLELYRRQVEYARTHPAARPTLSEDEYIALYTGNLLARYRTRSAIALEQIGGPDAARALERALELPLREDVREVVAAAARGVRRSR